MGCAACNAHSDPWRGLNVGVATYTLRELPIEDAIKAVQRVGLRYLSIKNVKNHIDLSHTSEERQQRARLFRDAGLIPMSVGNVSMRSGKRKSGKPSSMQRMLAYPPSFARPAMKRFPSSIAWLRSTTFDWQSTIMDRKIRDFFRRPTT